MNCHIETEEALRYACFFQCISRSFQTLVFLCSKLTYRPHLVSDREGGSMTFRTTGNSFLPMCRLSTAVTMILELEASVFQIPRGNRCAEILKMISVESTMCRLGIDNSLNLLTLLPAKLQCRPCKLRFLPRTQLFLVCRQLNPLELPKNKNGHGIRIITLG